jgi:hypothetical protein
MSRPPIERDCERWWQDCFATIARESLDGLPSACVYHHALLLQCTNTELNASFREFCRMPGCKVIEDAHDIGDGELICVRKFTGSLPPSRVCSRLGPYETFINLFVSRVEVSPLLFDIYLQVLDVTEDILQHDVSGLYYDSHARTRLYTFEVSFAAHRDTNSDLNKVYTD